MARIRIALTASTLLLLCLPPAPAGTVESIDVPDASGSYLDPCGGELPADQLRVTRARDDTYAVEIIGRDGDAPWVILGQVGPAEAAGASVFTITPCAALPRLLELEIGQFNCEAGYASVRVHDLGSETTIGGYGVCSAWG